MTLDTDLKAANKAADILIAEALRLREQRDELLKALEKLLITSERLYSTLYYSEPYGHRAHVIFIQARDAIAKVKGS